MRITRFQVFGQRCSGTNALIKLVEANFPDLRFTEDFGFKHWFVPEERPIAQNVLTVVIARDVTEWVQSLHRNPWHADPALKAMPFSRFIRAEWRSVWDQDFWGVEPGDHRFGRLIAEELCPATGRRFRNALEKRTAKLENWLGVCKRSAASVICSHDQLVHRPSTIVDAIAEAAECDSKSPFVPVASYKGQREIPFEPKRYSKLAADDREHIERYIDARLEAKFGLAPVMA